MYPRDSAAFKTPLSTTADLVDSTRAHLADRDVRSWTIATQEAKEAAVFVARRVTTRASAVARSAGTATQRRASGCAQAQMHFKE